MRAFRLKSIYLKIFNMRIRLLPIILARDYYLFLAGVASTIILFVYYLNIL